MKPNNCWGSGGGHVKLTSDELSILLEVSENEVWQDVQANEKQHANLKQRKEEKKKISAIWKHEMIYIYKYTAAWTFNIRRKKAWSWSITEVPGFKLNLFQMKIVFSSCISSHKASPFRNFKIPTLGLHPISLYVRKQCEHSSKLVLLCSTE